MKARLLTLLPALLILAGALYGFSRPADATQTPRLLGYTSCAKDPVDRKVQAPVDNQFYNLGNKLLVQPGVWRLSYRVAAYSSRKPEDTGTLEAIVTLSATPDGETDRDLTTGWRFGGTLWRGFNFLSTAKVVVVKQPTVFYLNVKESSGSNWDTLQLLGENGNGTPTTICAERVG